MLANAFALRVRFTASIPEKLSWTRAAVDQAEAPNFSFIRRSETWSSGRRESQLSASPSAAGHTEAKSAGLIACRSLKCIGQLAKSWAVERRITENYRVVSIREFRNSTLCALILCNLSHTCPHT